MTSPEDQIENRIESIENRIEKLKLEFSQCSDWEARYQKIIDMGKALAPMAPNLKTEDKKVKGCQSQVWLHAELTNEGLVHFAADSDAVLVRGLIALLLSIYSDSSPDQILAHGPQFLKDLGLEANLSPSRANGLHAMLKQIQYYALAFKLLKAKSSVT